MDFWSWKLIALLTAQIEIFYIKKPRKNIDTCTCIVKQQTFRIEPYKAPASFSCTKPRFKCNLQNRGPPLLQAQIQMQTHKQIQMQKKEKYKCKRKRSTKPAALNATYKTAKLRGPPLPQAFIVRLLDKTPIWIDLAWTLSDLVSFAIVWNRVLCSVNVLGWGAVA